MHFQKQDMSGTHYNWDEEMNRAEFMGQPSRRLFDRYNGSQVLFIINFYGSICERFSLAEGRKLEDEISNRLPLEAKSEISVFNWIRNMGLTAK